MGYNYSIKINEESVSIENFSIVTSKDRELDFGRFDIPRSTKKEPYDMLSDVSIAIDDNSNLFEEYDIIIESDNVTPINAAQTLFKHEITLIERTKKLEYHTIGNRAMAQPQTGTKKSLWDRINDLRLTVPFETTDRINTTRIFEMGTSLEFLKDIEAPEFYFYNKTLREAIDTIMDYVNGLARLTRYNNSQDPTQPSVYPYNTLEIDLFNETNNEIDKEDNDFFQNLQNINEYNTATDITAQNQVFDVTLAGGSIFVPNENEYIGVDSDDGSFAESSSYVNTRYKKYRQTRVQMEVPTKNYGDVVIDISENVVEQDIYNTLEENKLSPQNLYEPYKSNCLIWNQQSDRITNLYTLYNSVSLGSDKPVIELCIKSGLYRYFNDSALAVSEYVEQPHYELKFNLAFSPFFNSRSQVERMDGNNSNIDKRSFKLLNQSETILGVNRMLDGAYIDQQQRGTPQFISQLQSTAISKIKELGDYSDRYILTKREVIFDTNSFIQKLQFDLNYQKRSERIAINASPELFEIPSDNRTVERNVYYSEYVIARFDNQTDENTLLTATGRSIIMNTLRTSPLSTLNKPILNVGLYSDEIIKYIDSGTPIPIGANEKIYVPVISYGGGNSLNFYFKFDSPNIAGNQKYDQAQLIGTKKALRAVQYTDELGQLDEFNVEWSNDYDASVQDDLPYATSSATDISVSASNFKLILNGGDILSMTYAIHIIPEDGLEDDIIIGDRFIKRNNIIEVNASEFANCKFIECDKRYNRFDNKVGKTGTDGGSYTVGTNFITVPTSSANSWAIVDDENNLLLAVNQRKLDGTFEQRTSVYFQTKRDRGDVVNVY